MIRPFTCLCMLAAAASGLYLYQAKHRAQMLDREIAATMHQAELARDRSGVLRAEWTLMNDPQRLAGLADHFLTLKTTQPGQFTTMAELDNRLPPVRPPAVASQAGTDDPAADAAPSATPAAPATAATGPVAAAQPAVPATQAQAQAQAPGQAQAAPQASASPAPAPVAAAPSAAPPAAPSGAPSGAPSAAQVAAAQAAAARAAVARTRAAEARAAERAEKAAEARAAEARAIEARAERRQREASALGYGRALAAQAAPVPMVTPVSTPILPRSAPGYAPPAYPTTPAPMTGSALGMARFLPQAREGN